MPDGRDLITWNKFKSRARSFLELLMTEDITINILIGLYAYKSCRKGDLCIDCESKYVTDLVRHVLHAERFPKCNWRISDSSHIKCVIMENKNDLHVVTGSRNFGDSDWTDISMDLGRNDAIAVRDFMREEWKDAKELTNDSLVYFLAKSHISQETIDQLK